LCEVNSTKDKQRNMILHSGALYKLSYSIQINVYHTQRISLGKNMSSASECLHKQVSSKVKNGFETCLYSMPIVS